MKNPNQINVIWYVIKQNRIIAGPGHLETLYILEYTSPPMPHPNPKMHSPTINFQSINLLVASSNFSVNIGFFFILII